MTDNLQVAAEKRFAMLEQQLIPLFAKAPHIPQSVKNFLMTVAPWLSLVGGVLGLFAIFTLGFVGMVLSMSFLNDGIAGITMALSLLAGLVSSLLNLFAFAPLRAKQKKGWNFIFYSQVLSVVVSLVSLALGQHGIIGSLLFSLIGFWLMFEVRAEYK